MSQTQDRKEYLGLLARAPSEDLAVAVDALGPEPGFQWLRAPEIGAVMVRGRAGGTGAPFNIGEMSVTRCSLRLASGEVGHGTVQGRDKDKARLAALVDALMQGARAADVAEAVLEPLRCSEQARHAARARKAAATKVDFFTMARGED